MRPGQIRKSLWRCFFPKSAKVHENPLTVLSDAGNRHEISAKVARLERTNVE